MHYDDVIVGAGTCGSVLAARLSEDPARSVLLIEAGPDYPTLAETPADLLYGQVSLLDHDWAWQAQVDAERSIHYPRGKVTGGSSAQRPPRQSHRPLRVEHRRPPAVAARPPIDR